MLLKRVLPLVMIALFLGAISSLSISHAARLNNRLNKQNNSQINNQAQNGSQDGSQDEEVELDKIDINSLRQHVLNIVNQDRQAAGLNALLMDDQASQVGDLHCREMLSGKFFSHWNRAGYKPYYRYEQSGGTDAVAENLSLWEGRVYFIPWILKDILKDMHIRMMAEEPPADGHRQTILTPQYTHLGVGIAFDRYGMRVAEEFIARYVEVQPIATTESPGKEINIKGKLLDKKRFNIDRILVYFEPFPEPLSVEQLNTKGSYSLPEGEVILRPLLSNGQTYTGGGSGEFEYDRAKGSFIAKYRLPKDRTGLYTICVLINDGKNRFLATNIGITVK